MSNTPLYDETCREHNLEPLDINLDVLMTWGGEVIRAVETIAPR